LLNGAVEGPGISARHPSAGIDFPAAADSALDPKLKLVVAHGLFDLATPYFGSKILLDQLPAYASPSG
jgi:hypothetical protein